VLGFNTARGDGDENLQINNGSKYKKSKTRQLTLDEPERLNKAVDKIVGSKQASMTPKNNRNSKRTPTSKRGSRTAEFRKSMDLAKRDTTGRKNQNFVNAFNTPGQQDTYLETTEYDQEVDNEMEEDDMKEVVCIL